MYDALEKEAEARGEKTGVQRSASPAPETTEQEGPEAQKRRDIMAALEDATLTDPKQRLSPLSDNAAVVPTLPGLSMAEVMAGKKLAGHGPFAFAARGSKKRVLEALKAGGRMGDKANKRGAKIADAMLEALEEAVNNMDVSDTQGVSVTLRVDTGSGSLVAKSDISRYEAQVHQNFKTLEEQEDYEEELREEDDEAAKKRMAKAREETEAAATA